MSDPFQIKEMKEICRNLLKNLGEPKTRHLSIARTELENVLLRLDCELRAQGVSFDDEELMHELTEKTEENKKEEESSKEQIASA